MDSVIVFFSNILLSISAQSIYGISALVKLDALCHEF